MLKALERAPLTCFPSDMSAPLSFTAIWNSALKILPSASKRWAALSGRMVLFRRVRGEGFSESLTEAARFGIATEFTVYAERSLLFADLFDAALTSVALNYANRHRLAIWFRSLAAFLLRDVYGAWS